MINQDNLNNAQLEFVSASFLKRDDNEMCAKYADMYLEAIFDLKIKLHRDYFETFFLELSPIFLGRSKDLDSLRAIKERVEKERLDDSHFLKLLTEAIQKLEMVIRIRNQWK